MAKEKITIQIGDEIIELKGAELQAFNADRAQFQAEMELQKAQQEELKQTKKSAYTKLGLTQEEINAIL